MRISPHHEIHFITQNYFVNTIYVRLTAMNTTHNRKYVIYFSENNERTNEGIDESINERML